MTGDNILLIPFAQAKKLVDEYWVLKKEERAALEKIVAEIDCGVISTQDEYTEAKKVTDKLQCRISELNDLFETAIAVATSEQANGLLLKMFRKWRIQE